MTQFSTQKDESVTVHPEPFNQDWSPLAMVPITNNQSITPEARLIIEKLNQFVMRPGVLAALRRTKAEAEKKLQGNPDLTTASAAFDLSQYGLAAPDAIGSARVVVGRNRGGGRIERHANSTQYMFVLDGPLETHVQTTDGWRVDRYGEGNSTDLEDRWHVVPLDTWHKSVVTGIRNWGVLAFHTAREVSDEYRQEGNQP
jgi:hypothetical protein